MEYPKDYINKVICGDCLEVMKGIPDNSVDLVITSPPYDNLRDYKGYSFSFENIAKELYRTIKDGGVVVWVVGDATVKGSETGTSFKQALYFKELGFNLHDTMIYQKTHVVFPETNRYYPIFEYMFVFSKGKPNTTNLITDRTIKYPNKSRITTFRQPNGKTKQKQTVESRDIGIRNNIWIYDNGYGKTTLDNFAYDHPAIFPDKLAKDHIISWSNPDDTVLDPMCGSGTTLKQAKILGRRYIGIEISPEYCKIAEKRLSQEMLFE